MSLSHAKLWKQFIGSCIPIPRRSLSFSLWMFHVKHPYFFVLRGKTLLQKLYNIGIIKGNLFCGICNGKKGSTMAKTIALVNQKGGVGKTTSCVSLGSCLQSAGARVLVCDFDPQGNATSGFGVDKGAVFPTIYDVLISGAPVEKAIVKTPYAHVLPANKSLAGASVEMIGMPNREPNFLFLHVL